MRNLALLMAFALTAISALAAPDPFVVKESLGIPWKNQRLTFPEPAGFEKLRSPVLLGPDGIVAFQRFGGSDPRIAIMVETLAPGETRTYRWSEGTAQAASVVQGVETGTTKTLTNGAITV